MSMRVKTIAAALGSALLLVAFAPAATASKEYVLKHPKRERCKVHYVRRVKTVRKKVHGRIIKRRKTVCVHRASFRGWAQLEATPVLIPPMLPSAPTPPVLGGPPSEVRASAASTCTTTFTGAESNNWGTAANWTGGVPSGFSSYGCIPSGYPSTVTFSANTETPTEIGGVSAENSEGITLADAHLTLANRELRSIISNVKPGGTAVTLDEGVILALTGTAGGLGGNTWNGPGTLEIPRGAVLKMGDCPSWGYKGTRCASSGSGTPTPGHEGLQVRNFGRIFGGGMSLCRNGAAQPAKLENHGIIQVGESGGFGGASECGEVGSVVNGKNGTIGVAQRDGNGCNVVVGIASLLNEGLVDLGSCLYRETDEVHRAKLEIGSSLSEAGSIDDDGIIHIQGDYTPTGSAELTIGIKPTEFAKHGTMTTNYGTMKVSGNATLAGGLNVNTYATFAPSLGQAFQILEVEEGSLSGEFTLGEHCIPAEPGDGYNVSYKLGSKGTVTLEAAKVAGC